jgi:choline-glycine betaine transporter
MAMEPVFGEAYKRPFRNIIDILAIIATVMGIATSTISFFTELKVCDDKPSHCKNRPL